MTRLELYPAGGVSSATADATYLRLDASNDPVTGSLEIANDVTISNALATVAGETPILLVQGQTQNDFASGRITAVWDEAATDFYLRLKGYRITTFLTGAEVLVGTIGGVQGVHVKNASLTILSPGNIILSGATQQVAGIQKQNLLSRVLGESISGAWIKTTNPLRFNDNVSAAFGTDSDMLIYHDNSHGYIKNTTGAIFAGPGTGNAQFILWGANSYSWFSWAGVGIRTFDNVELDGYVGIGINPSTAVKLRNRWAFATTPSVYHYGFQNEVVPSGSVETTQKVFAADMVVDVQDGAANVGRSFYEFIGLSAAAKASGTQAIAWASSAPRIIGALFNSAWASTGVWSGTSNLQMLGGEFQVGASVNPSGAMTMAANYAGRFLVYMTGSLTNLTVTDAASLVTSVTLAGTVTRVKGLYVPAFGGSAAGTAWGIQTAEDVQINSDKKLILEGSDTVKGDSYLVYVSGSSRLDTYLNAVLEASLSANLLDVVGDVRGRQLIADGDSGGIASTVTITKTIAAVSGVTLAVLATTGGGPAGATQSHWLKFYDGVTARYIPVWT